MLLCCRSAQQTPLSAVLRGRPRARPTHRAPSPNFTTGTPSHVPSHLLPPSAPAAMATSLDSGLNLAPRSAQPARDVMTRDLEQEQRVIHRQLQQQLRSRASDSKCKSVYMDLDEASHTPLDQFGQPYFTPQKPSSSQNTTTTTTVAGGGGGGGSGSTVRDEFGLTPFSASQEHRRHSPITGGPGHFPDSGVIDEFGAPRFASRSSSQQSSMSSESRSTPDLFGARPFVQSTDAFGATPFVTS